MNKITLNLIEKALKRKSNFVKANKTWQKFYDNDNIGTKTAGGFLLSDSDLAYLQTLYDKHTKTPMSYDKNNDNRLNTASHYVNEKWAREGVFDRSLMFASPITPIATKTGLKYGGRGCILGIDIDEIIIDNIEKIIIVENGTMITHANDWYQLLPDEWQSAILLYRGHGNNANFVHQLLNELPKNSQIAIYADFDMAGLDIVASFAKNRAVNIVLPNDWRHIEYSHIDNQPQLFYQQNTHQRAYLSPLLNEIYEHIYQHKLAIVQENVLRLGKLAVFAV